MKQIDTKRIMQLIEDERARIGLRPLARALGVSTGTIENWRLGVGAITPPNVERIADYFSLHPLNLYQGGEPMPNEEPHDAEIDRLADAARQLRALSKRRFYAAVDYFMFELDRARKEPKDEGGEHEGTVVRKMGRHLASVGRKATRPTRKAATVTDTSGRSPRSRALARR